MKGYSRDSNRSVGRRKERGASGQTSGGSDESTSETTRSSGTGDASHVLLLEDDDSLRQLLTHKLESSGYETTAMANGQECWTFLSNRDPPDCILLDVMVPGLDGFRLLGRIRNDERLEGVPVIVLTARGREEDVLKGYDLGADDYVTKPFSPSALVARVRRMLS